MTKEELKQEAEEYRLSKADCQYFSEPYKMKIERAYIAGAEPREKRIAELQDKLNNLASVAEIRLANWQKYEKENAELKKESDFFHSEKGEYKGAFLKQVAKTNKVDKQLTKAKKIIKELMSFSVQLCDCRHTEDFEKAREEAEQFLSEVKK